MIGILVVSHGRLAEEMILAMEHVVGMQQNVDAVCILASDDMEEKRAEILSKVESADVDQVGTRTGKTVKRSH